MDFAVDALAEDWPLIRGIYSIKKANETVAGKNQHLNTEKKVHLMCNNAIKISDVDPDPVGW